MVWLGCSAAAPRPYRGRHPTRTPLGAALKPVPSCFAKAWSYFFIPSPFLAP